MLESLQGLTWWQKISALGLVAGGVALLVLGIVALAVLLPVILIGCIPFFVVKMVKQMFQKVSE